MKRSVLMIISALICGTVFWFASSCNKESNDEENLNCVTMIHNSPQTTILSKSEMDVIKNLFDQNQLDYTKYLFTRFQKDELGHHHIRCYQFANNLIVFTSDAIFHFDKNNNYYYLSGNLINTIELDTKPSMSRNEVVEKFINALQNNHYAGDKEKFTNDCFELEFGYYDLNVGVSDANENFIKAWKIKMTNRTYPYAYINDKNSEIIYYDNGIRW